MAVTIRFQSHDSQEDGGPLSPQAPYSVEIWDQYGHNILWFHVLENVKDIINYWLGTLQNGKPSEASRDPEARPCDDRRLPEVG